jgi:uncharacterized protein with PIN domain
MLITRDAELYQKAIKNGVEASLVQSEKTIDQLKEIAEALGLRTVPSNTRCPRCNGVLDTVEKEAVKEKVPKTSFNAFKEFWVCTECDAVYWRGSHWVQIEETLNKIES